MNNLENMDPVELGKRLSKARNEAGFTQEKVATELGMARTTLVAIENGQRKIKPEELLELSSLFKVSANRLLRTKSLNIDLVAKFRQTVSKTANSTNLEAIKLLNKLATSSCELELLLKQEVKAYYPPEAVIKSGSIYEQAEDVALLLRNILGLGLSPIEDIVTLLEIEMGIRVFIRPIASSISGVFAYDQNVGACILINSKHPRKRRTMTAAHELGHFMISRNWVDVFELQESQDSREDKFANAFSHSFLMPATAIRKRFAEYVRRENSFSARHIILMAHAFHVSAEAMCRRLERLKLLPEGTYEKLREKGFNKEIETSILGDQPLQEEFLFSPRLSFLLAEAHQKELLTEGQLCDLFQLERVELRKLLDVFSSEDQDVSEFVDN